MIPQELSLNKIKKTYESLSPYVLKTPFIKGWKLIDEILNTNSYFKMEFLQHAGTFKARGAINNILNLTKKQKLSGITAVSAGNHAIASSFVAHKFNLKNNNPRLDDMGFSAVGEIIGHGISGGEIVYDKNSALDILKHHLGSA